jgi:hypothetical protein
MTDIDDDDELQKKNLLQRCREIIRPSILLASPIISVCCAAMVIYFTYMEANRPPPADVSTLAVSILKSGDASPEMREWATAALGLQHYTPIWRSDRF